MMRWIIMIGCVLLWQTDGMAQSKDAMPAEVAEMLHRAEELSIRAQTLYEEGRYDTAVEAARECLVIRERHLGSNHPDVAKSLNKLALSYQAMGDFGRALPLYERALTIREKTLGPIHSDVAQSLNNLAALYQFKGDYERARPLYGRALVIWEKVLGPVHPHVATSLNNLAMLHQDKGDYERALPLHERALAIREKALGATHPDVAQSLNNLATLHHDKEDYERALPLHERALAIREKVLGTAHPDVAQSLNNLAMLHQAKGNYQQALPLYERARDIWESALGPVHPDLAISLDNLAILHWAQGEITKAIYYFRRAEDAREAHLKLTIIADSEQGKRTFLATLADDISANLTLALQTGKPAAMRLAFTKVLRRKGRVLGSMTTTFAAVRYHPEASVRARWEEYRANRTQYATLLLRGAENMQPEQHRNNLDALQARAADLEQILGDKSREFRDRQTPITVEAVQAALPRDAALVEWIRYQPFDLRAPVKKRFGSLRYAACVLRATGSPHCLDLGDAKAIDADIKEMRDALDRNLATLPAIARRLEARIMALVRAHLGDTSHVYLAPDGLLHLIPFAALCGRFLEVSKPLVLVLRPELYKHIEASNVPVPSARRMANLLYLQRERSVSAAELFNVYNRYLVEHYTFTYLTSGRELLHRVSTERAFRQVLITADPARGEPGPGQREVFSLPPLPAASEEAHAVAAMFRHPLVLQGAEASEALVKRAHGPLIWHYIGHAHYSPHSCSADAMSPDDPRLQSALAMAGANVCRDGNDDGLLTAVEVAGLDLGGTKLVVLSACESGVGATGLGNTPDRVADGVYGLRRALVMAGSETQVMSLWKVDDHATRYLMEAYYRNLLAHGMGRSEALRQIQLDWLKSNTRYASPAYWAAFVVSGNDLPLDAGSASTLPRIQRSPRGCACDASSPDLHQSSGMAFLVILVLLIIRRRRPRWRAGIRLEPVPRCA